MNKLSDTQILINHLTDDVDECGIEIHSAAFNNDFDEIGWEPEVIDDSDDDAANIFGY